MPFNLAVFDIKAVNDVIEEESEIKNWYLAGHSLDGAMASSFAEDHLDQLEGLIFLPSYSAIDLTETYLPTLMVYGTKDQVMDREK